MSRTTLPFHADDMSALARSLKGELTRCDHTPGHVELLNMLARSTGYRNFQHFRADLTARDRLDAAPPVPPAPAVDHVQLERLLRLFTADGRLTRWPSKFSHRLPCLWVLWSRIPPRRVFGEKEINRLLDVQHQFGDHALLRRELCDHGLMTRTIDGREYRRVEQEPPPQALALVRRLAARHAVRRDATR